ncbi:MAG: hypothetical protein EOP38_04505 [Rubrivivax sp.]|nr:MAG: hypothetical protein EOP38_04505 [Rubrivivax sp.]
MERVGFAQIKNLALSKEVKAGFAKVKAFAYWIRFQRSSLVNWLTPELELVFSHACAIEKEDYKSKAPKSTELEDLRSRMDWIGAAANRFHMLMRTQKTYMENQLKTMAGWVAQADR